MVTTPNEWTIFEWDETPKTNKSKWYLINWARKEGAKRCRIFKITFSRSSRGEEIWESWRRGTGPSWDRTVSGRRLYWWRGRSECSPVERHIPEINNITTYMYIIRLRETEIQIAKKNQIDCFIDKCSLSIWKSRFLRIYDRKFLRFICIGGGGMGWKRAV